MKVYRSDHPDVLAVWDEYSQQHPRYIRHLRGTVRALNRMIGDGKKRNAMTQATRLVGLEYKGSVPEGWKVDKWHSYITPKVSTKIGKQARKLIDACQPPPDPRNRMRGMPATFMRPGRRGMFSMEVLRPGLEEYEVDGKRYLYVSWDEAPKEIDRKVWKPVKLSEYYALREAREGEG